MKAEQYTTAALVGAIIGFCWLAKKRKEKIGKLPYGKIRTKRYTKDALLHAQNVTVNDELYKKNGDWYISEALQQRTGVEQIKYKKDLDILLRAIKEQDNGFIVDHDEIIIEEAPVEDVPVVVEEAPAVVDVTPEQEEEQRNYNKKLYTEFSEIISKFDKNRKIVFYFTKEYIYCTDTLSCFKLPNESSQHSGTFKVDVKNKFFRLTDEETKLTQTLVSFFEVEIPENAPAHEVQTFNNLLNVALEKEKVEELLPGETFNLGNFYFEMYGQLSIKIGNNYYPVKKLKKVMEVIKIGGGGTTLYNVDNYLICYNDRNDRAAIVSRMV